MQNPKNMLASITGNTKILGVIADPVSQARTPAMANTLLDERGILGDFVMLPMQVSAEDFPAFIIGLRALKNFGGAVVSMPHKIATANLVDELTPEARLVGAVNVIRRNGDGRLIGTMLDGEGFISGLVAAGNCVKGGAYSSCRSRRCGGGHCLRAGKTWLRFAMHTKSYAGSGECSVGARPSCVSSP